MINEDNYLRKRDISVFPNNLGKVHQLLNSYGFIKSGSGMYATVFIHPNLTYAVKIFGTWDTKYLLYLNYIAKSRPTNPYFPKIKKDTLVKLPSDYYLVKLEKLEKFKPINSYEKIIYNNVPDLITNVVRVILKYNPKYEKLNQIFQNDYDGVYHKLIPNVITPTLFEWCQIMAKKVYRSDYAWDCHAANIMRRSNGQLVMIDPLYT